MVPGRLEIPDLPPCPTDLALHRQRVREGLELGNGAPCRLTGSSTSRVHSAGAGNTGAVRSRAGFWFGSSGCRVVAWAFPFQYFPPLSAIALICSTFRPI